MAEYQFKGDADELQRNLYKKFPSTHFLSNPQNVDHVLLWNTFFRRNLHRLALDYLKINLHFYQALILYLMGISQFIVIVACRAAAKSFIIALYACCRCITRPGTIMVISSATKGQSRLIVSEKIQSELCRMSPQLKREIKKISTSQNETIVEFHNDSKIIVVTANDNARGHRSNAIIREEFRQIDKKIDDSVLSPFQVIRNQPYMTMMPYSSMQELQEEAVDIYISSSWFDNGHWMWGIVDEAFNSMLKGDAYALLAFDESITLKHNIRTQKQMQKEKKKQDVLTWRIEFLNERVKENTSAFFTYSMLQKNQRLKQIFIPRNNIDAMMNKRNKFAIPKQQGEIRIVSCDMAFVQDKLNDNSIFSCIRGLPEVKTFSDSDIQMKMGYRRSIPWIDRTQGGETTKQALRIRQLYEDFNADYIVLDTRNGGIAVLDMLQKVMYDEERRKEYPPLKCMNNDGYASRCSSPDAPEVIFAINASPALNSEIAFSFRSVLNDGMIDLLVPLNTALEEILPNIKEYTDEVDLDVQMLFEQPFLETQALISETTELLSEKNPQTGAVKVFESGNNRKDRYTSVSYGSYFISLLEKDMDNEDDEYEFCCLVN